MKACIDYYRGPTQIDSDRIDFVAEDGRLMFQVRIGKDGRSLEVSACDVCKVGGTLYNSRLVVEPLVTNAITISTRKYED